MSADPAKLFLFPSGTPVPQEVKPDWSTTTVGSKTILMRESPIVESLGGRSRGRISIDDLYSEVVAVTPELATALKLLGRGLEDLNTAISAAEEDDEIQADDAVQRFQGRTPELFNCRDLGDSFGAIIAAVINALKNRRGDLLSSRQIATLKEVMVHLRSEPFMDYDEAVEDIMKLEEQGFIVEPQSFEVIADWLDE